MGGQLSGDHIEIPDANLFMQCDRLERAAFTGLPAGFSLRRCRRAELDAWKDMHSDTPQQAMESRPYMDSFFERVYAPAGDLFFERCIFICDGDMPVGTCMLWPLTGGINTLHWFKICSEYEGHGLGRALLSAVLAGSDDILPVCLHTQPSSFRAIKLYTDFGFRLITDAMPGHRHNDIETCLPVLERVMTAQAYSALKFTHAAPEFIAAVRGTAESWF